MELHVWCSKLSKILSKQQSLSPETMSLSHKAAVCHLFLASLDENSLITLENIVMQVVFIKDYTSTLPQKIYPWWYFLVSRGAFQRKGVPIGCSTKIDVRARPHGWWKADRTAHVTAGKVTPPPLSTSTHTAESHVKTSWQCLWTFLKCFLTV